jgi:hypothetical protein
MQRMGVPVDAPCRCWAQIRVLRWHAWPCTTRCLMWDELACLLYAARHAVCDRGAFQTPFESFLVTRRLHASMLLLGAVMMYAVHRRRWQLFAAQGSRHGL